MHFLAVICLTLVAAVSSMPHGATSYQNIHHFEAGGLGGYGGGYGDGGYGHGGYDGGYGHGGHYKYEYGVKDPHTGDHKDAWEKRDGDVVKGGYSLKESDGTTRVVEYKAGHGGFHAEVKRIGHAHHPHVYGHGYGAGYGGYGGGYGAGGFGAGGYGAGGFGGY